MEQIRQGIGIGKTSIVHSLLKCKNVLFPCNPVKFGEEIVC